MTPLSRRHLSYLIRSLIFCGAGVLFSGCRSTTTGGADAPAPPPLSLGATPVAKAAVPDESALIVNEITPPKGRDIDSDAAFPQGQISEPAGQPRSEYPGTLIKGILNPDKNVQVLLNFDAAPLSEVVPLFASLLHFNYLVDPAVKGAVTMTVDSDMTAKEVWGMFEHILWLSGAYASRSPGVVNVMPFKKMPRERHLLAKHEPLANVSVIVLPVRFGKSSEMLRHLQPFLTDGATVEDLTDLNSLLIVESPVNISKIKELASLLDVRGESDWPHMAVRCRNVEAETVKEELDRLLPVLGFPVTDATPSQGRTKVIALPRLQVLVVSAALPDVLQEVKRWIGLLDRQDASEQENLYFYNVRHSTADHLAEALPVFFNNTHTTSRKPRTSSTKSVSAKAARPGAAAVPLPSTHGESDGAGGIFDAKMIIYADTEQNRLTIRTTQRAYTMVHALLRRLDMPPRQVMIQAIVADITLSKSTEFGFSYAAQTAYQGYLVKYATLAASLGTGNALSNPPDPADFANGMAMMFQKDGDRIGFIRAVAGDSNVSVLSAPQILATNDNEAVIKVGDRVPIVTGDYSNVDGVSNGTIRRNIEYTDTGVTLTVTPHISAGNEVKLDVVQEVSDAVKTESSGIDSPTIQTRKLSTSMVVPDGGTVLFGGLIKNSETKSKTGIPVLMRLPIAGALFRSNSKDNRRSELLVLITANVVQDDSAMQRLTERYKAALKKISEDLDR